MTLPVENLKHFFELDGETTFKGEMEGKAYIFVPGKIAFNQSNRKNARYVNDLGSALLDIGVRAGPDIYRVQFDNIEGEYVRMELIPFPKEEPDEIPGDGICH